MQLKCLYCGCMFEAYDARIKYCSDECRGLARKATFERSRRKRKMMENPFTYVEEESKTESGSIECDGGDDRSGMSEGSGLSERSKEYLSAASVKHKTGDDEYCVRWKKSENMLALERLAKEAYDHGMNYGKYVAKENK